MRSALHTNRRVRRGLNTAPRLLVVPSSRQSAGSLAAGGGESREPQYNELVYHMPSPDFCERNVAKFVPGTAGRECNKTSDAANSCELICCGRGYITKREQITSECNCQFQFGREERVRDPWAYKCMLCQENKEFYTCK